MKNSYTNELFNAVISNDPQRVIKVLENFDNIEDVYEYRSWENFEEAWFGNEQVYPIHYAYKNKNIQIVKLLLDKGAILNPDNNIDSFEIILASPDPNEDIVDLFLEKNKIINIFQYINLLCKKDVPNFSLLRKLIQHNPAQQTKYNVLNILGKKLLLNSDIIDFLFQDTNFTSSTLKNILLECCPSLSRDNKLFQKLFKSEICLTPKEAYKILKKICLKNNSGLREFLLEQQIIKLETFTSSQLTNLVKISLNSNLDTEFIKNLIKLGADINMVVPKYYKESNNEVLNFLINCEKKIPLNWFDQTLFKEKNDYKKIMNKDGNCRGIVVYHCLLEKENQKFYDKENHSSLEELLLAHNNINNNLAYFIALAQHLTQYCVLPEKLKLFKFSFNDLKNKLDDLNSILDKEHSVDFSMSNGSVGHTISIKKVNEHYIFFDPNQGNKIYNSLFEGLKSFHQQYSKYNIIKIADLNEIIDYYHLDIKDVNSFKVEDLGGLVSMNLINEFLLKKFNINLNFDNLLIDSKEVKELLTTKSLYKVIRGSSTIDLLALKFILENVDKSCINLINEFSGKTPFHIISSHNDTDIDIIKYLISNGGDVTIKSSAGNTILHHACVSEKAQVEIINYLFENGYNEDINCQNNNGQTALHWALQKQSLDLNIVKLLIEKKAHIYLKDKAEKTPIDYVSDPSLFFEVKGICRIFNLETNFEKALNDVTEVEINCLGEQNVQDIIYYN